jgi:hypothetical protein
MFAASDSDVDESLMFVVTASNAALHAAAVCIEHRELSLCIHVDEYRSFFSDRMCLFVYASRGGLQQ